MRSALCGVPSGSRRRFSSATCPHGSADPEGSSAAAGAGMTDTALQQMSPRFARMYSKNGRPSIAPERLLRALLLQVLYTIRSERQLMEQLDYNLLYRWFVGLDMDDAVWDVTVFTKNRERLLQAKWPRLLARRVEAGAGAAVALGRSLHGGRHADRSLGRPEEFSNARTTRPRRRRHGEDGGQQSDVNFHGDERRNDTHRSTTDPEARLFKKWRQRVEVEPHGACVDGESQRFGGGYAADEVDRQAERESAWRWLARGAGQRRITWAATRITTRSTGGVADVRRVHRTWPKTNALPSRVPSTNAPRGMRATREPAETQTCRGDLRLDQNHRWPAQTKHRGRKRVDGCLPSRPPCTIWCASGA